MDVQKGRLLVVDNNRMVADTMALVFGREGYEVRIASSAEQALALVRDWQPLAAIVEVHLPNMGGGALARLMRLACPDCRVALMSGKDIDADLFAHMVGDFPLIAKPIQPERLPL